jgi:leucyl/phenylalanyl-tRNA--protein transferase
MFTPRSYANETWISEDIIEGYCSLFKAGYAYSIEVWQQEKLVGGLYGVTIGKGCFGESMFSTETDVSKMAFIH